MAEVETSTVQAEAEQAVPPACPVLMHGGAPCGRPLYKADFPGDKRNVCLMHTHDPNKDDAAFQEEFERILKEAGEGTADFSYFVFPKAQYGDREFRAECIFSWAKFMGATLFSKARFAMPVSFGGCEFKQPVSFWKAEFSGEANLRGCKFGSDIEFTETVFSGALYLSQSVFERGVTFLKARFLAKAILGGVQFSGFARFQDSTFEIRASFNDASFAEWCDFSLATFKGAADFNGVSFSKGVGFVGATFGKQVYFVGTTFGDPTDFSTTSFCGLANFTTSEFLGRVKFDETWFQREENGAEGPVFSKAQFHRPEGVLFHNTYLGRALFSECDVSRFVFTEVKWLRRHQGGRRMVFEEAVSLREVLVGGLGSGMKHSDERNYALIAELYQQLKKNYDAKCDYWTAGDFHYGEMEMKRLSSPRQNKVLRWLHRNFGLVAWYKYASEYGESYVRPALWMAAVVLIFALLYPLAGLSPSERQVKVAAQPTAGYEDVKESVNSYATILQCVRTEPGRVGPRARDVMGHSLMTTLGVAFFQRDLDYQPSYPWGRVLQWVELLLTSSLIALFLLAVRRQFRR